MVNTVGSYETKFWNKKWIPIKDSIFITKKQRELIIGSLLGDATMRIGKGAKNANVKMEHGLNQKEYVEWKYEILKPWVFTPPKLSYRYRENGERYLKSWWFRTIRHPKLTEIYKKFYIGEESKNRKKIIPRFLEENITPLMLSVLIMDDGSYSKKKIDISTYSFSLEDICFFQKCLKNIFDVESNFYKDRDKGYRMYFNQKETKKLIKLISPYIIPSMKYKIGFVTP